MITTVVLCLLLVLRGVVDWRHADMAVDIPSAVAKAESKEEAAARRQRLAARRARYPDIYELPIQVQSSSEKG